MYKSCKVIQIVAANNLNYIGKDGNLMWHNQEDLKHFKDTTMLNVLILGRKTFETLPKSVNIGRILLPVSNAGMSLEAAFEEASKITKNGLIYVIGGAEIYKATMKYTDEILLSRIDDSQVGDCKYEVPLEDYDSQIGYKFDTFNLEVYTRKQTSFCNVPFTGSFELTI